MESNLQEESLPTYIVNTYVQDQFYSTSAYYDGNLLTKAIQTLNTDARLDMERKLKAMTSEKLAAVAAGHELEDTAKNSALTGSGNYDAQEAAEADARNPYYGYAGNSDESTTETPDQSEANTEMGAAGGETTGQIDQDTGVLTDAEGE